MPIDWNSEIIVTRDSEIYNKGRLVHEIQPMFDGDVKIDKVYSPITYSLLKPYADEGSDVYYPVVNFKYGIVKDFEAEYDEFGFIVVYSDDGRRIDNNDYYYKTDADGNLDPYDEFGTLILYNENGETVFSNGLAYNVWEYNEYNLPVVKIEEDGVTYYYDENGYPVTYDENGVRYLDTLSEYGQDFGIWYFDDNNEVIEDFPDDYVAPVYPWDVIETPIDSGDLTPFQSGVKTFDVSLRRNTVYPSYMFTMQISDWLNMGSINESTFYPKPSSLNISSTSVSVGIDWDGIDTSGEEETIKYMLLTFNDTGHVFKLYNIISEPSNDDDFFIDLDSGGGAYTQWGMYDDLFRYLEEKYKFEGEDELSETMSISIEFGAEVPVLEQFFPPTKFTINKDFVTDKPVLQLGFKNTYGQFQYSYQKVDSGEVYTSGSLTDNVGSDNEISRININIGEFINLTTDNYDIDTIRIDFLEIDDSIVYARYEGDGNTFYAITTLSEKLFQYLEIVFGDDDYNGNEVPNEDIPTIPVAITFVNKD